VVYEIGDIMQKLTEVQMGKFQDFVEKGKTIKLYKHLENEKFISILKRIEMVNILNQMYQKAFTFIKFLCRMDIENDERIKL